MHRADGCDPLHTARWIGKHYVLIGDWGQTTEDGFKQFTRLEQEVRVGRTAKAFVADGEGFVNQDAIWGGARDNRWQLRAVEIIGHDDGLKGLADQRPWLIRFEIAGEDGCAG